jgi:hypothetical protein
MSTIGETGRDILAIGHIEGASIEKGLLKKSSNSLSIASKRARGLTGSYLESSFDSLCAMISSFLPNPLFIFYHSPRQSQDLQIKKAVYAFMSPDKYREM